MKKSLMAGVEYQAEGSGLELVHISDVLDVLGELLNTCFNKL